jgi:hypothetical protein
VLDDLLQRRRDDVDALAARAVLLDEVRAARVDERPSTGSIASPTRRCISSTENPFRIFIPSSAAPHALGARAAQRRRAAARTPT